MGIQTNHGRWRNGMTIQEFEIVNGETSIGSFCTVNAKLPEGAGLACVPNDYEQEQFRLYHPGSEGYIQNYGFSGGKWHPPEGLASQIDLQSPISSINCNSSSWNAPASELSTVPALASSKYLPESARFAAVYTEAWGSDNISTLAKVTLFVVEDRQLQVCEKNGTASWSPPVAVSIERDGANIAAVSPRNGDGVNDVHVFTSEEDGQFVHRILKDGDWEDAVINPAELLPNPPVIAPIAVPEMRLRTGAGGHGDLRIGVVVAGGRVDFGRVGETDKQFSHIQIPHDEDHEHIILPKLGQATYEESRNRLTFFYRAAIEQTASVYKSALIDSDLPSFFQLSVMKQRYKWSNPRHDYYPPHLDQGAFRNILDIFKFNGIFNTDYLGPIVQLFASSVPWSFSEDTIGDDPTWFTDEKFAQQHFSGTNPTTIRAASNNWVASFVRTAKLQGIDGFEKQVMAARENLYVQDYSYFRASMGQKGAYELSYTNTLQDRFTDFHGLFFHERYACASVVLFELHEDGHLHPSPSF
ncbi:uncharacterized protein DFL_000540 [Arthrobotrys flagrans]|uniref:Fucose-specific lectin n=1 Tax=Arthrobotrys flagrans TaxID=97331 RepID=A0A437AFA8_ARTFL|nr:hypothetical protein DFL_000540 [Arthrobotrys flagrans]